MIVDEEMIRRNGELETRKRAKLIAGDVIEIQVEQIRIELE
jgi:ribosome-associated protein